MRLPCELFLWPTSRSYTREPVAELHTIGSSPLLEALVDALGQAGARLAEPGEFTLRAFLAGRIDLTQAEAVLGVIDAHGDAELDAALAQLAGGLARPLATLRGDLLQLLAELEAGLDFVDEDIEFISQEEVRAGLASAVDLLDEVSQQMASRATAGPTAQVVLVGSPNVGKSSLFNALVEAHGIQSSSRSSQPQPALVSPQRGTTRDYLTAAIELDGMTFELVDTAGMDELIGTGQRFGIDETAQLLATERRAAATIRLHCIEFTDEAAADAAQHALRDIVVVTKCDLAENAHPSSPIDKHPFTTIRTSSRTGEGLDRLTTAIRRLLVADELHQAGQVVAATADRCWESVRLAQAAVERAGEIAAESSGHELVAAEIRIALAELGKVVGAVYTDDLLDRIFSTFCIGK